MSSSDQVERELKLGAWPEFVLPDLAGALDGIKPGPATRTDLDAVYFDTVDLHLLRRGATLRFRRGEAPGDVWTLKLPSDAAAYGLARRELTVAGARERVPDDFSDLTRGWALGRKLRPVARVRTVRISLPLCDKSGAALARLDDDSVTVQRGRRVVARFRELEVELAGETSSELLAAIDERLHAAGAENVAQIPKLSRALGRDAAQPWQLALAGLGSKPTLASAAHAQLVRAAGDLVDLHALLLLDAKGAAADARAAAQRLRSSAELLAQFAETAPPPAIAETLVWLDAELAPISELDAVIARLDQDHPAIQRDATHSLAERAGGARRRARNRLIRALREPRYVQMLQRLEAAATTAPVATRAGGRRVASGARKYVRGTWRALRDLEQPPPQALRPVVATLTAALELARAVPNADADAAYARVSALAAAVALHDESLLVAERLRALARGKTAAEAWAAGVLAGRELERSLATAARISTLASDATQKAAWAWTE